MTAGSRNALSVACFVKGADPSIVCRRTLVRQILTNGAQDGPFATALGATLSFHINLLSFAVAAVRLAVLIILAISRLSKTGPLQIGLFAMI